MNLIASIKAALRTGTPLVVIRTADPSATILGLQTAIKPKQATTSGQPIPLIQWDVVRGAKGLDTESQDILTAALTAAEMEPSSTTNPSEFLGFSSKLPPKTVIFMLNLHRFVAEDIGVIQALWNVRDEFKTKNKCVIGLCPQITLPAELSQDVLILDEPLPTDADLKAIAEGIYKSAQIEQPDAETYEKIVDATLGLAAFPAEQAMAMSITKKGMDIAELWSRKKTLIGQAPGLAIVPADTTFNDIGGVNNIKMFLTRIMKGKQPPRVIVWIDEAEKAFAGSSVGSGDSSGVSQGFLGSLLTEMQERKYRGAIFAIHYLGTDLTVLKQLERR